MEKKIAQTVATTANKSKVQIFGEQMIEFLRKNPDKIEQTGKSEWTVHKDGTDFVMVDEHLFAKSGRKCFKKNLYRIEGEKRRIVQFGSFRKQLLYKMFMLVEDGHRVGKQKIDMNMVKSLANDIRQNKSNYSLDKEDLVGKFNNDEIRIKNSAKLNKAGKEQIIRQLFINGELATEGCLLNVPMRAFTANQKRLKKSAAEILAEAEASVADLI